MVKLLRSSKRNSKKKTKVNKTTRRSHKISKAKTPRKYTRRSHKISKTKRLSKVKKNNKLKGGNPLTDADVEQLKNLEKELNSAKTLLDISNIIKKYKAVLTTECPDKKAYYEQLPDIIKNIEELLTHIVLSSSEKSSIIKCYQGDSLPNVVKQCIGDAFKIINDRTGKRTESIEELSNDKMDITRSHGIRNNVYRVGSIIVKAAVDRVKEKGEQLGNELHGIKK
jgi:hypothetical protein